MMPRGILLPILTRRVTIPTVEPEVPAPRVIRRYGNRKLYDPVGRRYVTLQDVARLVAGGTEVRAADQATGEDITNLVLAQVLLERVRQGASRIPRQVLARLIRIAAGPASAWGEWPEPRDSAGRARIEAERIVARVMGGGRLSLDDAVALRRDISQLVHRLVSEAQSGVESRLGSLLEKGEGVAGRSLDAIKGGIQAFEAYIEKPASPAAAPPRRRGEKRRKR
jgi:polyhydroxyalkanoate synthesis repressor PhaR